MIWLLSLLMAHFILCQMLRPKIAPNKKPDGMPYLTANDKRYWWHYTPPTRTSASSKIYIDVACPFDFSFTKEIFFHHILKWFGFCRELQTGDAQFDKAIFIVSDDGPMRQKLCNDYNLHAIILELLQMDVKRISCNANTLTLHLINASPVPTETTDALVEKLYKLKESLANMPTSQAVSSQNSKQKLAMFFGGINLFFNTTFMVMFLVMIMHHQYQTPEDTPLLLAALHISLAVIGVMLILIWLCFHRSSYGQPVLTGFLISIVGLVISSFMFVIVSNDVFDDSPPTGYSDYVVEMHIRKCYCITTTNWDNAGKRLTYNVGPDIYGKLKPFDHIFILVHSGFWGAEWIEDIRKVE